MYVLQNITHVDHALQTIKVNGLQNILTLRGDPPKGQDKFVQIEGGFACALDLVILFSFVWLFISYSNVSHLLLLLLLLML